MKSIGKSLSRALVLVALGAPLVATMGCGNGEDPKVAQVKAGDMPAGGDWTGVYYSQLYGSLHLVVQGGSASGKWRTSAGDKWGELHGTVTGDLLKYDWEEHTIGMVGPSATTKGKGYFKYKLPKVEGDEHIIVGEWGLGDSETGQKWEAIRQRNVVPEPDSVMPDETQKAEVKDEWD